MSGWADALAALPRAMPAQVAVGQLLGLLLFRTLPFAAYATVSSRLQWPSRVVAVLFIAALVVLQEPLRQWRALATFVLAYAYYYAVSPAFEWIASLLGKQRIGRRHALVVCVFLAWLVPVGALAGMQTLAVYVLASEITLAAFSYCVDGHRGRAREGDELQSCRFFLLVNPTLVWTDRGHLAPAAQRSRRGVARLLGGCVAVLAGAYLVAANEPLTAQVAAGLGPGSRGIALVATKFLALYASQSGVASIRISCMRLVGFEVPECYRRPFLARRPDEFWRRWNVYLGNWFKSYVFGPTSDLLRQRFRKAPLRALYGAAALATFGAVGVYHDAVSWTSEGALTLHATTWFLGAGAFAAGWAVVASSYQRAGTRETPAMARVLGTLARTFFWCVAGVFVLYW